MAFIILWFTRLNFYSQTIFEAMRDTNAPSTSASGPNNEEIDCEYEQPAYADYASATNVREF